MDLDAEKAFGLFGRPESQSWLFAAHCDVVRVGAAVSLRLPHDDGSSRFGVDLLGHIAEVRPNSSITIAHTQPWEGRIRLRFDRAGWQRTRVRVRADVGADGVAWLIRRTGIVLPTPPVSPGAVRIGMLTSKSGPGAMYAIATEHMAELAVEEINNNGGVAGRTLELVVADDGSDPATAAAETRRLLHAGCRAIFVVATSSSFAAARRVVGRNDVLLVHAVMNEGGSFTPQVIRFGERPARMIEALAGPLMKTSGARNWYLVGHEYSWSYGAHFAARAGLARAGGRVVGDRYTPLGTNNFGTIIEQINASRADVVMSSLVGADDAMFQRQCYVAGLRATTKAVSLVLDESTCEHIGAAAAEGIWTAKSYFEGSDEAGNRDLLTAYRDRHGPFAPPLSSLSETVYECIVQYARTAAGDIDATAAAHGRALGERSHGPDSRIGRRDLQSHTLYLAEVRGARLQVFDKTS